MEPVQPSGQRANTTNKLDNDGDEFQINPSYQFEEEPTLCPVEEVCAYESMRASKARLEAGRDSGGVHRIRALVDTSQIQMHHALQAVLHGATPVQRRGLRELELTLALQPWIQTAEFLAAVGRRSANSNQHIFKLPAMRLDASREMRERTGKYYHFVRDSDVAQQSESKPGVVAGTSADLRKLSMLQSEKMLVDFGVAESVIKSLRRWQRVDMIRSLSGAATQNAHDMTTSRFTRSDPGGLHRRMLVEQRAAANKSYRDMQRLEDNGHTRRMTTGATVGARSHRNCL